MFLESLMREYGKTHDIQLEKRYDMDERLLRPPEIIDLDISAVME
jgi:hypothetical protein